MLEAAGDAFAARGFHGASMDEIAAAAGISKPMLYTYFGSKEGLYAAYVQRSGSALLEAVRIAAPRDAPARERLAHGVLAFLAYVDEHRAGWSVLYSESVMATGPVAEGVASVRERLTAMLETTLPAADGLRAARAHALIGALESLAEWWLEHPDELREQIAALFLRLVDA